MGDSVGYRIKEGGNVSNLIRTQWMACEIKETVTDIARALLDRYGGCGVIGDGSVGLRNDLSIGRMTSALYHVVRTAPFDRIETDPMECDITDNGLYEIELIRWNYWKVFQYPIPIGTPDASAIKKRMVAAVMFTEGKTLDDGMNYKEVI